VLNLLTYRYVPAAARAIFARGTPAQKTACNLVLDSLNESIQKEQRAGGKTFVSRTRLQSAAHGGQLLTVFRVVLANPLTTPKILADILEEQRGHAQRLLLDEEYAFAPL
jgi:glutamate decarboxylase